MLKNVNSQVITHGYNMTVNS